VIGNVTQYFSETVLRESAEKTAFDVLYEWRSSEHYEKRTQWRDIWQHTSSGPVEERIRSEHGSGWVLSQEGKTLIQYRRDLTRVWVQRGWAKVESCTSGRPRSEGPSAAIQTKARRILGNHGWGGAYREGTIEWAERQLWERSPQSRNWVLVMDNRLFEEVAQLLPPEELEGLTREELAQALNCSSKLAKALVRHLVDGGQWRMVHNGKKGRRELRQALP